MIHSIPADNPPATESDAHMALEKRIATVVATGARYIVEQIDFRANRVHTLGDITSIDERNGRVSRIVHEGRKSFAISEVKIEKVNFTFELGSELIDQTMVNEKWAPKVAAGTAFTVSGTRRPRARV